ncbi:hypothetical protein [Ruania albidiflava]|uniref:hypothetical protein n=1 Tax=Ruania albidiflava TaxID=366586 RepID=UPI0003B6301C|nr:hypothetical protein [Ruania albidiflava]
MAEREEINVGAPPGGWGAPWPLVAEIESVVPHEHWTLVGGLMAQLYSIDRGIAVVRPTDDVDMVVHIETRRGVPNMVARALESIGFVFQPSIDDRSGHGHRFARVAPSAGVTAERDETVDVLIADHPAPRVVERLHGRTMVGIEGGTQALRRTVNAPVEIVSGRVTTVSVPSPFGAVILKAAAYRTDSRGSVASGMGRTRPPVPVHL